MPIKVQESNPSAFRDLEKRLKDNYVIAVGFPASKTKSIEYPNGESVVKVAAANNFGVPDENIPRRPFMSISKNPAIKKVKPIYKALVPQIVKGNTSQKKVAQIIAPKAVSVFKKVIVDLREPPNAPSTIKRKKSSNPLIDKSIMVQSLTFEIRKLKDIEKGDL